MRALETESSLSRACRLFQEENALENQREREREREREKERDLKPISRRDLLGLVVFFKRRLSRLHKR